MKSKNRGKLTFRQQEARAAWIMMAPALLLVGVIAIYPILRTFWISFHEMNLKRPQSGYPFVGLENYAKIFTDARAGQYILFTLKFTVVTVLLEMIIGFAAALIMNRTFK